MAYCTQDDLVARLDEGALANLTNDDDGATVDSDKVTEALDDASGLMDSYFQARYPVPLSPVPAVVLRHCATIAIYFLFSRHGLGDNGTDSVVRKNYEDAIRWLEQVSKGVVSLGIAPPEQAAADVRVSGNPRVFTRDSMGAF